MRVNQESFLSEFVEKDRRRNGDYDSPVWKMTFLFPSLKAGVLNPNRRRTNATNVCVSANMLILRAVSERRDFRKHLNDSWSI